MTSIFENFTNTPAKIQQSKDVQTQTTKPIAVKEVMTEQAAKTDTFEPSTNDKKTKKGPIKTIKGFIANVKKFFATVGEYTKGIFKGVATGAVAGSVVYTGGAVFNAIRQGLANRTAQKTGEEVAKVVKKFPNKIAAGLVAVGALAANIWTASLNATEKQSEIDMRWTGIETKK